MTILVTYSNDQMSVSKQVCCEAALANGVDTCWPQNPDTISREFKEFNKDIWKQGNRGADCYWLFKPYVIYNAILKCQDGDTLIYLDAGVKLINNVQHIINVMDQDLFLFSNGHQHVHWCKSDVMEAICPADTESSAGNTYIHPRHQQAQASAIFIRVNDFTRSFIKEWLMWCQMPGMITDAPSKIPNHPEFADHRHDQAILTCLAIKHSIKLHYWADQRWYSTQRHRWPGDDYPLMFDHHRKRDPGTGDGNPTW